MFQMPARVPQCLFVLHLRRAWRPFVVVRAYFKDYVKTFCQALQYDFIFTNSIKHFIVQKKPSVHPVQQDLLLWVWRLLSVYCSQISQYFRSFLEEMEGVCSGLKREKTD